MKKTLKTLMTALLAMAMVFTMTGMAFAVSGMNADEALNIALKDAGLASSEVRNVEKEYDAEDKVYEIEFTEKNSETEYEYEISSSGKILEKSVDHDRAVNKGAKNLTKSDAISKTEKFRGIKKTFISK